MAAVAGRERSGSPRRAAAQLAALLLLLATCILLMRTAAADGAGASTFIRVDQVGYPGGAAKRAYLMSRDAETGAPFAVLRSPGQTVVFSGTVGASVGAWNARFSHVYPLDFDALQAPGSYSISLGGRTPVLSPQFAIAPAATLYEEPLANALSFYQNERDGPDFIPSALRSAPAHLNDQSATAYVTPKVNGEGEFKGELTSLGETLNASGGWWDAGDYLKFVETTSYAVDLQLIGVRDFPAQMGAASARSNFTEEARFGVEWLMRMWNDETRTLYYQVGIGAGNASTISDHDIWRLPQADDTYGGDDPLYRFIRHRPVFRAGAPGFAGEPEPRGTRRGSVRAVLSGIRPHVPRTRRALPVGGRAHL